MQSGIRIENYSPQWPAEFRRIATMLKSALGPLALRIDHIGSTAVPGLAAKDRIDIQLSVAAFDQRAELAAALMPLGFHLREHISRDHVPPGFSGSEDEWHKLYFVRRGDERSCNLHVRQAGRANQRYALLCRDYLRSHAAAAAAYEQLKRRLAELHPDSIDRYVYIKDPVFDIIVAAAEEWAASENWQLPPSDC